MQQQDGIEHVDEDTLEQDGHALQPAMLKDTRSGTPQVQGRINGTIEGCISSIPNSKPWHHLPQRLTPASIHPYTRDLDGSQQDSSTVRNSRFWHLALTSQQPVHGHFQIPRCLLTSNTHESIAHPSWPNSTGARRRCSLSTLTTAPLPSVSELLTASRAKQTDTAHSNPGSKWDPGGLACLGSSGVKLLVSSVTGVTGRDEALVWANLESDRPSQGLTSSLSAPQLVELSELEHEALENIEPPVTKENLKELELPAVQNTLSLRIDLCFDHDLFFQRISGSKGEEKRRRASIFYQCLCLELRAISHNMTDTCLDCERTAQAQHYSLPSRLASFFTTLRDLLELLVPDAEKEDVVREIDADWLTCQVRLGQFNAAKFASWLCQLLTNHCAPIRDEMAREMRDTIIHGAATNDMELLVKGLELMLNLLENMKLDVANHQVRSFKTLLIADTVPFLRDCFSKLVQSGQLDLKNSQYWFENVCDKNDNLLSSKFECFLQGLIESICYPEMSLPATFEYDKDRIDVLRNDIYDFVQLEICEETFRRLFYGRFGRYPGTHELQTMSQRLVQLMTSDENVREGVEQHLHQVTIEIARAVAGITVDLSHPAQGLRHADLELASDQLQNHLTQHYSDFMKSAHEQLLRRVVFHATYFLRLDTLQLSNLQREWSVRRLERGTPLPPDVEDISRRLAHVAVIHWQVWSDLIYLGDSISRYSPGSGDNIDS